MLCFFSCTENIIGKGGYAEVYKGQLENGQFVAIKRLTRGTMEEMTQDFLSELGIIVHVNHPNAAKLIGFGVEEGMHLVLQLSSYGCLAELLTGTVFYNHSLLFNSTRQLGHSDFPVLAHVTPHFRCKGKAGLEHQIQNCTRYSRGSLLPP